MVMQKSRTSGCWKSLEEYRKTGSMHLDVRRSSVPDIPKTNWESATITTQDDKIIPYITNICKRDPRSGKGRNRRNRQLPEILNGSMSWTINRQGQFKGQDPDKGLRVGIWIIYRRTRGLS
ncbi:MAG: oleate hydratase [Faecalimonas sp.]